MTQRRQFFVLLGALCVPVLAWTAPAAESQREISYLLGYLEHSGCKFQRNSTWYDAPAARAHLETKYRYLLQRDMVQTTDDFIERAATGSSMGGGIYTVRCANGVVQPSAAWLRQELVRIRKADAKVPPPR